VLPLEEDPELLQVLDGLHKGIVLTPALPVEKDGFQHVGISDDSPDLFV
jgi:hypothetical protein